MWTLEPHRDALKFMEELQTDSKKCRHVVCKILGLVSDPRPDDSRDPEGHPGRLRTDVGELRIVYCYNDDNVYFDIVGKRNDEAVYKNL